VKVLAHDRKAGEHQGVQIPVDGSPDAAEVLCQVVQSDPVAAAREALDQPPLPRELVTPQA